MMGTKERHFASLVNVSLEELVPADHFYRHLERTLDLSFVRESSSHRALAKGVFQQAVMVSDVGPKKVPTLLSRRNSCSVQTLP